MIGKASEKDLVLLIVVDRICASYQIDQIGEIRKGAVGGSGNGSGNGGGAGRVR